MPLCLVAAYLYLLRLMAVSLFDESKMVPWKDPFKEVWVSGPVVFSVLYLLMVFIGKKYMEDKPEFQIKPYIFAYNLYQCILNAWGVIAMIMEV